MNQGDIVIINFPFTSLEGAKIRPALVISNQRFNKGLNIILLAISTQRGPAIYSHEIKKNDLVKGELLKKSYIRFANILSLEKKLILKKVASLKEDKTAQIAQQLGDFLA